MKIAIQTPPEHTSYSRLRDIWQAADELGFTAAFTYDHFVPLSLGISPQSAERVPEGPQFEAWTTAAALGAETRHLDIGTLVSGVTYRHPVLLAKMAVTLDHITGGRSLLGLGAAWHEAEHTMYGFEYPRPADRVIMLKEALEAFALLCHSSGTVDYRGRFVRLTDANFDPKPVRPEGIPVVLGGKGPQMQRIAARHADWYNGFWTPQDWQHVNEKLDALLVEAGRSPGDLTRSVLVFSDLSGNTATMDQMVSVLQADRGETRAQVLPRIVAGSPDRMVAVLESYANAGVDVTILSIRPDQGVDELTSFAKQVLPAFVTNGQ